jgi:hypothetical protein
VFASKIAADVIRKENQRTRVWDMLFVEEILLDLVALSSGFNVLMINFFLLVELMRDPRKRYIPSKELTVSKILMQAGMVRR